MKIKMCSKCKVCKSVIEFGKHNKTKDGLRSQCKKCEKEYTINNADRIKATKKKYYFNNKKIINDKQKIYRESLDKEKQREYYKNWREKNRQKVRDNNKKWNQKNNYNKKYYENNKSKYNEYASNRYYKNYYTNPQYKIALNIRSRVNLAIKNSKAYKSHSLVTLLGCTIPELIKYLESKFLPGMNWDNKFLWHIDHIIPCANFDLTNQEEQMKCFNYTNLQPLWAKDNLSKGKKIAWETSKCPEERW